MMTKFIVFIALAVIGAHAGVLRLAPATAAFVAPYASSYNAHTINHAVATPVAAPLIAAAPVPQHFVSAAPAHLLAGAAAPLVAAPYYSSPVLSANYLW